MAQVKNAMLRQRVIDGCLRSSKRYSVKDLMERCNRVLVESGCSPITSKTTILKDMEGIQNDFPDAHIIAVKESRCVYYEYEDKSFSIYKTPLNDDELAHLSQAAWILSRLEGLPDLKWLDDLVDRFRTFFDIPPVDHSIISFGHNPFLKGQKHFASLFRYIASRQCVELEYEPFGKDIIRYTFHPYFLKQYNDRWFLVGKSEGYSDLSVFPLDRILAAKPSTVPFVPNTEYDIEEYFDHVIGVSEANHEPEKIRLFVGKDLYCYISSKPIHGSQKVVERRNDGVVIQIEVVINHELTQLLLGYGPDIEVLSPKRLRDRIHKLLEMMYEKYKCVHLE